MKFFVDFKNREEANPIQEVIKIIMSLVKDSIVVDSFEDADLIMTNDVGNALSMMKENEEAIMAIIVLPGEDDHGARALKRSYPDKVEICRLDNINQQSGDKGLVSFILSCGGEK